jgi:hypothetical protein
MTVLVVQLMNRVGATMVIQMMMVATIIKRPTCPYREMAIRFYPRETAILVAFR